MNRVQDWERRLDAVFTDARERPYKLGVHDCFRVAWAAVEAVTGVDHWPEWRGRYDTERNALLFLASHGSNLESAGDAFFGTAHCSQKLARRGDIVAYCSADGSKHFGVCMGAKTAVTTATGLGFVDTLDAHCAWRIG